MTPRLLIATNNAGKQAEFRRLLAGFGAELVVPHDIGLALEVEEPYDTYEENAAAKATAFCRASGILTVSDDSGIEVAALGWGPGVRSARWGTGEGSQAEQLVEALRPHDDRQARMVCALAVAIPGSEPRVEVFTGTVDGSIARAPRGRHGFGYDPVFVLPHGQTTAELAEEAKDRVSHRGRAVAAALPRLEELVRGH